MDSISGFNVSQMFENTLQGISTKGSDLNTKMAELANGEELSNEQMISLQFEVGQYNTMMEALSTVTKSMTDMMKSLAQRSN
ncbi:EscF/YscF/HrpA family type III secretion system needle major subunit [uncultured Mailhella sp.]|uniref:EscF/YscF/HrpA family type III secretion system needle major subunit n=1 Tax=uncultured Mailhella sp. TaxID=1981031 RepID=UPI0025DDAE68|nr:EscF/YscF/HrpA family type III secretion system needle major subunit [uncultured Mailhella sp.]